MYLISKNRTHQISLLFGCYLRVRSHNRFCLKTAKCSQKKKYLEKKAEFRSPNVYQYDEYTKAKRYLFSSILRIVNSIFLEQTNLHVTDKGLILPARWWLRWPIFLTIYLELIMNSIVRFFKDEEGVTAIEYGLIAALIAIVIVAAVAASGTALTGLFNRVATCLTSGAPC